MNEKIEIDKYTQLVKEIRHRYELKYNRKIDDDLIILIIRNNELEARLSKFENELESKLITQESKLASLENSTTIRLNRLYYISIIILILLLISIISNIIK